MSPRLNLFHADRKKTTARNGWPGNAIQNPLLLIQLWDNFTVFIKRSQIQSLRASLPIR